MVHRPSPPSSEDGRLCGKESEASLIYFIVTKCTFQTMIRDRLKIRPRFVHLERVPNAGSVRSIRVPSTAIRPSVLGSELVGSLHLKQMS